MSSGAAAACTVGLVADTASLFSTEVKFLKLCNNALCDRVHQFTPHCF